MPKLIENVRGQLLAEAGRQLVGRGYAKTTIRSVAGACGIAVGTVYNYFPSKEVLIASFMAEDWQNTLDAMCERRGDTVKDCLRAIHDGLLAFAGRYSTLFADPEAVKAASGALLSRHLQLRGQLADLIEPFAPSDDGFTARFIAEALLTWTLSDVPFERIYELLAILIPQP